MWNCWVWDYQCWDHCLLHCLHSWRTTHYYHHSLMALAFLNSVSVSVLRHYRATTSRSSQGCSCALGPEWHTMHSLSFLVNTNHQYNCPNAGKRHPPHGSSSWPWATQASDCKHLLNHRAVSILSTRMCRSRVPKHHQDLVQFRERLLLLMKAINVLKEELDSSSVASVREISMVDVSVHAETERQWCSATRHTKPPTRLLKQRV